MSEDLIRRSDAIKALNREKSDWNCDYNVPIDNCIKRLNKVKSADRPQGEWIGKVAYHNRADEPIVEEWQSTMCSVCHKYHTTPYIHYFNNYNFCPNCGARMKGADDE